MCLCCGRKLIPTPEEMRLRLTDTIPTEDATSIDNLTDQVLTSDLPEQILDEQGKPVFLVEKLINRRRSGNGFEYQVKS